MHPISGGGNMKNEDIERIASMLFEYSLSEDEQYILDGLVPISNELEGEINENVNVDKLENMKIFCREISNYLTHIINEDNEHLQDIQMYLLSIVLQKLIDNRKDDVHANTKC